MNPTFPFTPQQLQWIAALKSGTYQKGRGWLCNYVNGTPTYCCLGVACELYKIEKPEFHRGIVNEANLNGAIGFGNNDEQVWGTEEIVDYLQLRGKEGWLKERAFIKGCFYSSLAKINDDLSNGTKGDLVPTFNFQEIAEYIEQNPDNVFTNLDK